ncbi:sensor histidine kinase [Bradymonas sediminis]|uniref:histidine kinase n=1 Tax=Bradymonas sediminis TaxID=1548548 RepID=A0A2Z4FM41_9DELT|nr:HAMP domain-containing sensor histidine kinase [Bradymonas sediminis]AWV90049.1 histidine kinase [Bradymonas sediminis]TDP75991.1 signal transduction histidine kinase [Bradymonas sediminis]
MRARPRLRTILLWVNLIVLLMPLVAVVALRLYETELIRRTEAEVLSQAALIKASYEHALREELGEGLGSGSAVLERDGPSVEAKWPTNVEDRFRPVPIDMDLRRDEVSAPVKGPQPPGGPVHPATLRAGARLEPVLVEAQKMTMSGMRVVDLHGNVLASSQEKERGLSVAHHEDVTRALGGEFVKILRARAVLPNKVPLTGLARGAHMQVVVSIPVMMDGRVVGAVSAWRTPISVMRGVYENRNIFGTVSALFLLGVLAITALTSVYIGRPIRRLMAQTERVADGGEGTTDAIAKPGTYEVQKLSEGVAKMAETLQSRAEYIRTFATNVSHEFKTPLTTIRGTVELFQDHMERMPAEKRAEFLAILDADAQRLERLVGRLLELARADVLRPDGARCDLVELLDELVEDGSQAGVDVVVESTGGDANAPIWAQISEDALRSVFSNLLGNAAQHGATELRVELRSGVDGVEIIIADDGPGISPANAPKIFDEFFTTRRDTGGTGLGLSIVRTMLRGHGGDIELVDGSRGAVFSVRVPR